MQSECLTLGVDHIGLSVTRLADTRNFFVDCLGFRLLGENASYPAAFVTDGHTRITLWQVADPNTAITFDRRRNVGLHHLAFKVASVEHLKVLYERVSSWPGIKMEFAPELSGKGPKVHCMFTEPSGNRVEIAWDPR
jgi:lactoylglutathione lyase